MVSLSIVTSCRVLSAHQAVTRGAHNFYRIIWTSFQEAILGSSSSHHERTSSDVRTGFAFPQLHSFRSTSSLVQIMTQSAASGSIFMPIDFYSIGEDVSVENIDEDDDPFWLSSTLKKRRTKMNKHKLKKRRKKLRLQNKK